MKASTLIARIRSAGGAIRLHPKDDDRVQVMPGRLKAKKWTGLKKQLRENRYLVIACLREERASRHWEQSGRAPGWWRTYPFSRIVVPPACRCNALPYPHPHEGPGPAPNVELGPGETVWDGLRQIVGVRQGRRKAASMSTGNDLTETGRRKAR